MRVSWQGVLPSSNVCVDSFLARHVNAHATAHPGMEQAADMLFFLTHLHTDHTGGLTPSWNLGTIYTSAVTKVRSSRLLAAALCPLCFHTPPLVA